MRAGFTCLPSGGCRVRTGQPAKKCATSAAGQFGLGFNCAYHVTDLPSFVSGRHAVRAPRAARQGGSVSLARRPRGAPVAVVVVAAVVVLVVVALSSLPSPLNE
jgi:hypothetical protein